MSMARRTRPVPASAKARTVDARSGGFSKPRVSTEEPDRTKEVRMDRPPSPQNMAVNPVRTKATHTTSVARRLTGPYSASTRSCRAYVARGPTRSMNTVRIRRNTIRASRDGTARGRMTVRTAEPNVRYTATAPATKATTLRATMRGSVTDVDAGCTAVAPETAASEDRGRADPLSGPSAGAPGSVRPGRRGGGGHGRPRSE